MQDAKLKKSDMQSKNARFEINNARCEIKYCEIPGHAPWSHNLTCDTAIT